MWAYATMGREAGAGVMRELEGRAEALAGSFNAQGVANTLWAYATMEWEAGTAGACRRPSPCDVIKLGLTRRDQRAQQVGLSLHDLLFDLIVALGRSWRLRPLRPEARAWSDDARMMMACASAWQVRLPGRGTVCKEK